MIVRDVDGSTEGRLPLEVPIADLEAAGHHREPLLAVIRDKCIDCSGGSLAEVRKCTAVKCPLWPYRMGRNPFRAGMMANAGSFARKNDGDRQDYSQEEGSADGDRTQPVGA